MDYMARNTSKAVDQLKEELLQAELDKFMEVALGSSFQASPRWF